MVLWILEFVLVQLGALPEAKLWPFARFQLDDLRRGIVRCFEQSGQGSVVAPGLWNHLVESFKELEIWTGKEVLQNMTDAQAASNSPPQHFDIQRVSFGKASLRKLRSDKSQSGF